MVNRHDAHLQALLAAVRDLPGKLDTKARSDLLAGRFASGTLGSFAVKVAENSPSIRDEHVAALASGGADEEAIFETIIATAVGSGMKRLTAALAALEAATKK
jgi:alkylhydroperoxidase family enzyme